MSLSRPVISRLSPNLRSHWLKETPIRFIPDFELHCYYKLQMINHAYNTQSIPEHRKSSWLKTWKLEDAKVSRVADGVKFTQGDFFLEWKHSHGLGHGIFVPISSVVTINWLTLYSGQVVLIQSKNQASNEGKTTGRFQFDTYPIRIGLKKALITPIWGIVVMFFSIAKPNLFPNGGVHNWWKISFVDTQIDLVFNSVRDMKFKQNHLHIA